MRKHFTTARHILPYFLILAGIAFLAIGIHNGEIMTIWRKATVICMECIGIG